MSEKVSFKSLCVEWVISLTVMVILTMACNIVGVWGTVSGIHSRNADSVRNQLPWTDKTLHPPQPLPAVTYIGIIGMLAAVLLLLYPLPYLLDR